MSSTLNSASKPSSALLACHNIADLRALAKRRLPRVMFDYMDGGAEDEVTLGRNMSDFHRWEFMPRTLVNVAEPSLQTQVQGSSVALPIVFAPTGGTRLFHHQGELALAAAAAQAGTVYSLSSMSTFDIETVGAHTAGEKWFQIYVWKDRGVVREFIGRCKAAGYKALCLTVDVQTSGLRERDLRNGLTLPPRFTPSALFDMALHPRWWWNTLTSPRITMANVVNKAGMGVNDATALGKYAASQLDPSVNWDDLVWMLNEWGGPFMLKGVLCADDARRAVELGASGVIVSNHGGRQLEHAASPITALPAVAAAVDGRADVILDGGVRRGSDVVKALALGATACMTGRSFLYGLAAGGEPGVARAVTILREEIQRTLMLLGCADVKQLNPGYLRRRD